LQDVIPMAFRPFHSLLTATLLAVAFLVSASVQALTFRLPENNDEVVGDNMTYTTGYEDTFVAIGRVYGLGFRQMMNANPDVHPWVPGEGTEITLPLSYILPQESREAIVLNLAEFRMYHFLPEKNTVRSYGVGIGREGWETPQTETRVTSVAANPSWTPPESIRREHAERGDILPRVVAPGPDNPLGQYAVRLALPSYLFHGSNKPIGVGMRVSHGCIRLYDGDIEELAHSVSPGTPVRIINEPVKAGWLRGRLYLEVHPQLEEDMDKPLGFDAVIEAALVRRPNHGITVDWDKVRLAVEEQRGYPIDITRD